MLLKLLAVCFILYVHYGVQVKSDTQSDVVLERLHALETALVASDKAHKTVEERLQADIISLKQENAELKTISEAKAPTKRFVVQTESPVAFHAVLDQGSVDHIGHYQNIVFETVLLNEGQGYHSNHGVFQAPVSGIYVFSASIMSYIAPKPEIQAEIVKNGDVLGAIFAHGDSGRHDQGALTVSVQLNATDEVWVRERYPNDGEIFGARFSTFTGFLIYSY